MKNITGKQAIILNWYINSLFSEEIAGGNTWAKDHKNQWISNATNSILSGSDIEINERFTNINRLYEKRNSQNFNFSRQ
jgi:hypothetical protein